MGSLEMNYAITGPELDIFRQHQRLQKESGDVIAMKEAGRQRKCLNTSVEPQIIFVFCQSLEMEVLDLPGMEYDDGQTASGTRI